MTLGNKLRKQILIGILVVLITPAVAQEYDLLIRNGTVIDPKNGRNEVLDIAISNGIIVQVGSTIEGEAKEEINARGLLVVPGLVDIHSHNFFGTSENSYLSDGFSALPPDGFTFRVGVTTVVDVGGAGWRNFDQFKRQVIDHSKTRVLSFLNIVGNGMKGGAVEQNQEDMDGAMTAKKALANKEFIVGVKVAHYSGPDWTPVQEAVKAGKLANIPVMIDFGGVEPNLSLERLFLQELRPGDIFTHAYANVKGRMPIVDESTGKVRSYVFEAQKRGIVFDVGHGGGSFWFSQAKPALEQGIKPNTLSTDLHTGSMNAGMKDLLNVMSKFMNLGLSLEEVVEKTTWKSAQTINREELGHLSVGGIADIAILGIRNGTFGFVDVVGERIEGDRKLECEATIKDGKVVYDLNGISK